jgi:acyl-CoA thioesterase-1
MIHTRSIRTSSHLPSRRTTLFLFLLAIAMIASACSSDTLTGSAAHSQAPKAEPQTTVQIPAGPITYVALGASDAAGVGSNQPGSQGYVPLIAAKLPQGSHSINLGSSGIRLHEALTTELPIALSSSPNLVTIWLVVNDFIGGVSYNSYMQDLNTLLNQLRTRTHASIVMANLPDLTRLPAFSSVIGTSKTQVQRLIQHWNAGISALAIKYKVALVDLTAENSQITSHPDYISGDGFHPSPAGYVQLADLFWKAIKIA